MKFCIEKNLLDAAAEAVAKALPNRPSVPVLAGVKIVAADADQVTLSGFDYEVSTEITYTGQVNAPGAALVSGRLLAAIAKALPNKPVEVASVGAHLELVCGSARFTLPTMPVEDYPALPDMPDPAGTVDAAAFAAAVAQVAVASGRDETLPLMTGIRIEIDGPDILMMATDRYRLAVRKMSWTPSADRYAVKALVPGRNLADTAKAQGTLGGDITLALNPEADGMIGLAGAGRRVTSRLLDGANYPPVMSLFPDPDKVAANAVVSVAELTEVVKRVALVAERTTPVLLTFSGDGLIVEAGGTEEARASEAMDITSYTGDPLTIGFNPQYLIDGLNHLGTSTAHLAFVDGIKPAVISPASPDGDATSDYRYLIMPIRVSR
ncbi:DNA polymerase III subunit beta [Micromonospora echinospora]|uniref:DNA polymerase III subunit beta n=1 Tax=Micromonospora echinospora TaxID=1877 RepID=UPI0037A6BDD2